MLLTKDSFLAAKNWHRAPLVFNSLYRPVESGFFSSGAADFRRFIVSLCISMNYIEIVDSCRVLRLQPQSFVASTTLAGAQVRGFKAWGNAHSERVIR
jgi:hypothetical protein